MSGIVNYATARSFKALVLTEKALRAANCFRHSDVLASRISDLRQERADRIKIKEKIRSRRKMKKIARLEASTSQWLQYQNEIHTLIDIGRAYGDLASIYQKQNKSNRLAMFTNNYIISKAVKSLLEAAKLARERKDYEERHLQNLRYEYQCSDEALKILEKQELPLSLALALLKSKLEEDVPRLKNKAEQTMPMHGN